MKVLERILILLTCITLIFGFKGEGESSEKEEGKKIVLTFDDGPRARVLEKLLPLLSESEIKAIFFVVGKEAQKNPEWVLELKNKGHIIANHSFSHKHLTKLSNRRIEEEIKKTEQIIVKLTEERPVYFRPPYLCSNQIVEALVEKLNYKVSKLVLDPQDWETNSPERLISRVKKLIVNNEKNIYVFLFHERPSTVEALEKLLPEWEKEYIFTTEIP